MDTSKESRVSGQEENSDDLIAELARLVSQESGGGPAPRRVEPVLSAPEPRPEPVQAEAPRPSAEPTGIDDFEFDFGFGSQRPADGSDPIGDLIASAEAEPPAAADRFEEAPTDLSTPEPEPFAISQPAAAAPSAQRDPLAEIEALIGEAAHVGDTGPFGTRRVRSAFLSGEGEPAEPSLEGAEDTILAASAAGAAPLRETPAEPDFGDDPVDDIPDEWRVVPESLAQEGAPLPEAEAGFESPPAPVPVRRRRRARGRVRSMLVPALLGTLIVAGIGGIYTIFFMGEGEIGDAPVLTANTEPFKQEPEATNTANTANQSVVFNELDGTGQVADEALVSRDETQGVTGNAVTSVVAALPEADDSGLVNRRVRTVTVRPDGTIVGGEAATAGNNVLPVDRPNVPDVPNSTLTSDPIGEVIASAMGGEGGPASVSPGISAPLDTVAPPVPATAVDPDAPRPLPRPSGLTLSQAPAAQPQPPAQTVASVQLQAIAPATPPAAAAPAAQGPVGAWVQLSSQRSEEAARDTLATLQSRFGTLFAGAQPEVSRVDLAERGVYYRVRLPQPSLAAANSVCQSIQGQGGDCFVLGN